ncbi:MAG TPA: hypothetical protein VN772_04505 [Solirubrobacteraceae bacterium]|nr:hypothetical protein [Solirubrobacteraceae bacterium]
MRTDPAETGGLFIGRRPGTAPVRFRTPPQPGGALRQHLDGYLAGTILGGIVGLSLLCWGPIPLACLWIGSEVDYLSGSVFLGIVVAFLALFPLLFGALLILRQLDHAWILTRRAAGHDQRTGVMVRIFGTVAVVCALAFAFWFLVIHGPGSSITPGRGETPAWPG